MLITVILCWPLLFMWCGMNGRIFITTWPLFAWSYNVIYICKLGISPNMSCHFFKFNKPEAELSLIFFSKHPFWHSYFSDMGHQSPSHSPNSVIFEVFVPIFYHLSNTVLKYSTLRSLFLFLLTPLLPLLIQVFIILCLNYCHSLSLFFLFLTDNSCGHLIIPPIACLGSCHSFA